MIDTRTSTSRPWTRILMRPSCGKRFSAMLSRAMILMRLTIAMAKRLISGGSTCDCKQSVDAVADADRLLFVLDVDVARPLVGGFDQNLVHQLDDRCFLGLLGEFAVVGFDPFEQFDVVALLDEGLNGLAADAEVVLDQPGDFAGAAQYRLDLQTGQRLQFVERIHVVGVRRRDHERAVVPRDGQ